MQFTTTTTLLTRATEDAVRGCGASGSVIAILGALHLDARKQGIVRITGTDIDKALTSSFSAKQDDRGVVVVGEARQFLRALKTLDDGEVTVTRDAENDVLVVTQDRTTLRFDLFPVKDFPEFGKFGIESEYSVKSAAFLELWSHVESAVGTDESRPVLVGVQMAATAGRLTMAATDSFRLAFDWAEAKVANPVTAIVPGKVLALVSRYAKKIETVEVSVGTVRSKFLMGDVEIFTRNIEGKFPDVKQLIPDKFEGTVELNAPLMIKAATRAAKVARRPTVLRILLAGNEILLTTRDGGLVTTEESVPLISRKGSKDIFSGGVNPEFFAEAIKSLGADVVTLSYIHPHRPLLFGNGKEDAGVLQMPIRVDS